MLGSLQKIRPLKPGGCIGIVATGSPVEQSRMQAGYQELEGRGYRLKVPLEPWRYYARYEHGFTNGSAKQRAEALMELVKDDEVDIILTARGGYGALDLLPLIDFAEVRRARKALIGMSDVTALLLAWLGSAGVHAVHGAAAGTAFPDSSSDASALLSVESLLELLSAPSLPRLLPCSALRAGEASGPIIAGNLTMLTALLGTPWDVSYDGCILVVEETGEAPFRIHRSFAQLKLAGKLDRLSGLVFGRFSKCEAKHGPSAAEVIRLVVDDILPDSKIPVMQNLAVGHWGENQALVLGSQAKITSDGLTIMESPLELSEC